MRKLIIIGVFLGWSVTAYPQNLEMLAQQKPVVINGSIDIRGIAYSSYGIQARRSPFMYMLSGSPTLSLYGISIPFSFTYTDQNKSFTQPLNQFGLSPTYKWATAHVGYRNVGFSPYTLDGFTLFGGGFELNPGKFRLGLMTGRLNKATTVDTTTGVVSPYSFSRYGTAAKIGFGTDKSHLDLSMLSAKDTEKNFKGELNTSPVRPAANLSFGADLRLGLGKFFYVFADGGASIYTHDYNSSVAIDSLQHFNFISKLIRLNGTSEFYLAYNGGIGYNGKVFGLKAAYKYVDPDFKTMGAYYFQDDLRNITLSPTVNALEGKLRFIGSVGIQEDNNKKQKQATTRRVIGLANLSFDLNQNFGIDASYSNFSSNSEPVVTLIQNKYLLTHSSSNISISPRLIFSGENISQVIFASYNVSKLSDINNETQIFNDITSSVAMLNHSLTLNKTGLSVNSGVNYTTNEFSEQTIENIGFSLGVSKRFFQNKITLNSNNSMTISSLPQGKSNLLNLGLNLGYQPLNKHRVNLRVNYLDNKPASGSPGNDFSEITGELGYTFNF